MKRVKVQEIIEMGRPVKGNLICKHIKSNPSVLCMAEPVSSFEDLMFHDPEPQSLHTADVPLKSTDTSFSSALELKPGWYQESGIEECRIVDRPLNDTDEVHEDVEMPTLFDSGKNENLK